MPDIQVKILYCVKKQFLSMNRLFLRSLWDTKKLLSSKCASIRAMGNKLIITDDDNMQLCHFKTISETFKFTGMLYSKLKTLVQLTKRKHLSAPLTTL
jgi:hypothetical protein